MHKSSTVKFVRLHVIIERPKREIDLNWVNCKKARTSIGAMATEEWATFGLQSLSFFGFASLNIGLNFYNSWALKKQVPDTVVSAPLLSQDCTSFFQNQIRSSNTSFCEWTTIWACPPAVGPGGTAEDDGSLGFHCCCELKSIPPSPPPTAVNGSAVTLVMDTGSTPTPIDNDSGPDFAFPVFYTMWHMVASVLGSLVLMSINRPATGWPSLAQLWKYKWAMISIAMCTTSNIALNNISLTLISLFLNQVIKAAGPLPTMLFSVMIEGKRYGLGMLISCAVIVGGTIMAVPMQQGGPTTSMTGITFVLISTLAASLKPVLSAIVMKGTPEAPKLPPTVVLFYDTFISFWFMLLYWLLSAERSASLTYLHDRTGEGLGIIAGGATMAFGFNVSTYFFVSLTSALTTTVAANGVKVINIVISAIIDHVSNPLNWAGVAVVCCALAVYAYFSYISKNKSAPNLSGPLMSKARDDV